MQVPASLKVAVASLGLGGAIGATVVAILLAGECSTWREGHPKPAKPTPTVLAPTPEELATPKEIVNCVPVQVLKPSAKRAKQIAKETGRPLPSAVTLEDDRTPGTGEIGPQIASSEPDYPLLLADGRPYPKSPEGGVIYSWLEMDGSNTLVVLPNPEKRRPEDKFLSFAPVFELGGAYGMGQGGDTRGRAWGAYEAVRLGRIHLRVEAGVDLRNGTSGTYVLAGAVWRSR